jgi:hypothetical protein
MKLPSALVEVLEELEFVPSILASELWMNEEMMDCVDCVDSVLLPEALVELLAKAPMRF